MSGKDDSSTPPDAPATTEAPATEGASGAGTQTQGEKDADAADAAKKETWSQMADRLDRELGGWGMIFTWLLRLLGSFMDPEQSADTGASTSGPSGATARTLTQEITDVTTALGEVGKSGFLKDNVLLDTEKNTLKTELEQVRTALPGTMTDEARQAVAGMLEKLVQGGVQDADTILGQSLTDLRTAMQPAASAAR